MTYNAFTTFQGHADHLRAQPLSLEQVMRFAPSVFAPTKHESRSDRYAYIPTHEVLTGLMQEGFQPMHAQQGRSRVAGKEAFTKHLIRFRHGTHAMRQVGDTLPEVVLVNSHDGTSSYRVMGGLFRLACLNGLIVADSLIAEVKVGHTKRAVEGVIEATWQVVNQIHRATERRQQWGGIELRPAEAVAFAEAAHELRFEDDSASGRAIEPTRLLTARRSEDAFNDLWTTFNRVQENVIRGGLEGTYTTHRDDGSVQTRTARTREVKAIDDNTRLNRALWLLTERMAELKA